MFVPPNSVQPHAQRRPVFLRRRRAASTPSFENLTILGESTVHRGLKVNNLDGTGWLQDLTNCPALAEHFLLHLGVVEAMEPYRFLRTCVKVTEFLACLSGSGRVFVDGEWQPCRAGQAALLPMHSAIGYYAEGSEPWVLVWACFRQATVETVSSPVLADYNAMPLFHTVEALREEVEGANDPTCIQSLLAVVQRLVVRFAQPWQREDRLHQLWEKVAGDLGSDWTLERLAQEAHCCGEHLRRLCQRQIGRSPMQHVTYLRLQHAAELLASTDFKVEYIASLVGYNDPFAFSATFKKWIGCPPTEYRQQQGHSA